jgi:hypothetical protein
MINREVLQMSNAKRIPIFIPVALLAAAICFWTMDKLDNESKWNPNRQR